LLLPEKVDFRAVHVWLVVAVMAALFLLPAYAWWVGQSYYVTLVSRMMIYGIAATSLNLLVGYTGLVSLGHALFLASAPTPSASPPSTASTTAGCNWRWSLPSAASSER
jgi:hypothetical protein